MNPQLKLIINEQENTITVTNTNFAKAVYIYTEEYDNIFKLEENYFDMMPNTNKTVNVLNGKVTLLKNKIRVNSLYDVTSF